MQRAIQFRLERPRGFDQLAGMKLLEACDVGAAHARGELGRLLVALDHRALNLLLLCG